MGSSSHWASSTTQTSGRDAAASVSRVNTARPTTKRSGVLPAENPNATRNAFACGSGSIDRSLSIGRQSWWSAANGSSSSDSTPVIRAVR